MEKISTDVTEIRVVEDESEMEDKSRDKMILDEINALPGNDRSTSYPEIQNSDNLVQKSVEIDPFNWEAALDATIPDTVDESRSTLQQSDSFTKSCSTETGMKSSVGSETRSQSIHLSTPSPSFRFTVKSLKRRPIRLKVSVINDTPKPIIWSFKPVGPSTLQSSGHSKLVEDAVFKIEKGSGKLFSGERMKLSILFVPVLFGVYTALFHLKISTGVVAIWLDAASVESSKPNSLFKSLTVKRDDANRSKTMDVDVPKTPTPNKIDLIGTPLKNLLDQKSSAAAGISNPVLATATQTPLNSRKLPLPLNSAFSTRLESPQTIRHKLDFGRVEVGQGNRLYLKISNPDNKATKVTILATGDFVVPIRDLEMTPRTFFILPICFYPKVLGNVAERLIVRREKSVLRVTLEGVGIER